MTDLAGLLNLHKDQKYKEFMAPLLPTVDKEAIIGVRTPVLKSIAKSMECPQEFLSALPHRYYEENNIHAFIISTISDYDRCIKEIDAFLPYVDNWATCDGMRPKCFAANHKKLVCDIKRWILSSHTYTIRFGIEMLMLHFFGDDFSSAHFDMVNGVECNDYYVEMMKAWYFATALAKRERDAFWYVSERIVSSSLLKKIIQKAIDSAIVSDDIKNKLKKIRRGI